MQPILSSFFSEGVGLLFSKPALWPPMLSLFLFPVFWFMSRRGMPPEILVKNRDSILMGWGIFCVSLFVFSDLENLIFPGYPEVYEGTGVSISYLLFKGHPLYPAPGSEECYALPYGPVFFAILGFCQWLSGEGNTYAAKLPCSLAPLLALGLLWSIARNRGASLSLAWGVVGLEASLLLAIGRASLWTKSDPLLLLVVSLGLWVVMQRDARWSPVLGLLAGLAAGLKMSALVYFLPILALAFLSGWRFRAFAVCLTVLSATFVLPFILLPGQISFRNYISFLHMVANEGFSFRFFINYTSWVGMFIGLVMVMDRWMGGTLPEARFNGTVYRLSLLLGFVVIAVPASVVGAGATHHIPFFPLVLMACGPFIHPVRATRNWSPSVPWHWLAPGCAILLGTAMVAVKKTWEIAELEWDFSGRTEACLMDLRQLIQQYPGHKILMGTGQADRHDFPATVRHELVFAGHPIGLDMAVVSDYQMGGSAGPRLGPLLEQLNQRDQRPPLWLIPRGADPFQTKNIYGDQLVYSGSFRRDFHTLFILQGQSAHFDLYVAKTTDQALANERFTR